MVGRILVEALAPAQDLHSTVANFHAVAQQEGVLVVGSIAQDYVESPAVRLEGELGGSATYFALAARHFVPVHVVGCVGDDRAAELKRLLDFADLSRLAVTTARTYIWRAVRDSATSDARTVERFPGGYALYRPDVSHPEDFPGAVFLGSGDPKVQVEVARATPSRSLVGGDTMDIFIQGQRQPVEEVVNRCDILFATERELELLSRVRGAAAAATEAMDRWWLTAIVVKRGAGGAILWTSEEHQRMPAVSTAVVDPTGAGDALAGGMMGRLAERGVTRGGVDSETLKEALEWGLVTASYAISAPGVAGIAAASRQDLEDRLDFYRQVPR
jgi:cytidine kinase